MKYKPFLKTWLLHSAAIWLLVNIADVFNYVIVAGNYENPFPALRYRFINHNLHQGTFLEILVFCLAVEFNYQFIFQKFRFKKLAFATATVGLSLLLTISFFWYVRLFISILVTGEFLTIPLIYLLYTGFYIFLRNYFEAGKLRAEQQQQKTAAELNALKAQLHPHFFFNTLNTIYGTALMENAPKTADMTDRLSSLVRYVMEKTTSDFTTTADELQFIDDYFQLQQMRLPDRNNIRIVKNMQCDAPSLRLPPLLFIPFIENAFKYGISIDHDCFISLTLNITGSKIDMLLENTVPAGAGSKNGAGTGMANAQKRLQLLYPGLHKLEINNINNIFSVKLHIQL